MNKGNVIKTIATIVIMLSSALMSQEAAAASRIKDIADFEGIREPARRLWLGCGIKRNRG